MPSADEGTTIWVRDTGPGLAQPEIETLSQPFRRSRARNEYLLCETGLG
jgi:signal transduction histidine kinase